VELPLTTSGASANASGNAGCQFYHGRHVSAENDVRKKMPSLSPATAIVFSNRCAGKALLL